MEWTISESEIEREREKVGENVWKQIHTIVLY